MNGSKLHNASDMKYYNKKLKLLSKNNTYLAVYYQVIGTSRKANIISMGALPKLIIISVEQRLLLRDQKFIKITLN